MLVKKRVDEELERRKDEIELEVTRRVEAAKQQMEQEMMAELERRRAQAREDERQREVGFGRMGVVCCYLACARRRWPNRMWDDGDGGDPLVASLSSPPPPPCDHRWFATHPVDILCGTISMYDLFYVYFLYLFMLHLFPFLFLCMESISSSVILGIHQTPSYKISNLPSNQAQKYIQQQNTAKCSTSLSDIPKHTANKAQQPNF